jgi:prepilin-type N-terminal cleavage/methylation domain-containing protein
MRGLGGEFSVKNDKGYTLIELMIVLALIGIVLSTFFAPLTFSLRSFERQTEKAKIVSELRTTMDYLTRQIRRAYEIEVVDGSSVKIDSEVYAVINKNLTRAGKMVREGIDQLIVRQNGKEITIGIVIVDTEGREHDLYSSFTSRGWEI